MSIYQAFQYVDESEFLFDSLVYFNTCILVVCRDLINIHFFDIYFDGFV